MSTRDEWAIVMNSCRDILSDRQSKRPDVWRLSGARGMAFEIHAKAERLFMNLMSPEPDRKEALGELIDIINYSVFCYIQSRIENWNGAWPWPSS